MDQALIKNLSWAFGGLITGGTLGYLIAKKVMSDKYESIIDIEIAAVKDHYAKEQEKRDKLRMEGDYATPESAAQKLGVMVDEYGPDNSQDEVIAQDAIITQQFDDMPDISALDRSDDVPFVITFDEYNDDISGSYDKVTLTYYEEDLVLADDNDAPVDDQEGLVGDDSLERFGQWSKDPNIVYVRNEDITTDFEIIRKHGSYAEIVHGIRPERDEIRRMREE